MLTSCRVPSVVSAIDISKYEIVRVYDYDSGSITLKLVEGSKDFTDLDLNGCPDPFDTWEECDENSNVITILIFYDSDPSLNIPENDTYQLAKYEDIITYGAENGTIFITIEFSDENYGYSSTSGSLIISNSDGIDSFSISLNGFFEKYDSGTDLTIMQNIGIFGALDAENHFS
jgi:hypothetical protein